MHHTAPITMHTQIGKLLPNLIIDALDEGDGIQATCKSRYSCCNASCWQELHGTTLDLMRSQMQAASTSDAGYTQQDSQVCSDSDTPCKVPHITPTFLPCGKHVEATCFFCNKPVNDLCQFITFPLDQRVRKCASVIGYTVLMGKLD